jgi:hypothetical protein
LIQAKRPSLSFWRFVSIHSPAAASSTNSVEVVDPIVDRRFHTPKAC